MFFLPIVITIINVIIMITCESSLSAWDAAILARLAFSQQTGVLASGSSCSIIIIRITIRIIIVIRKSSSSPSQPQQGVFWCLVSLEAHGIVDQLSRPPPAHQNYKDEEDDYEKHMTH